MSYILKNQMMATDAYYVLSKVLKSTDKNYLEIGSFNGVLVSKLAEEFPSKKFYCVDPFIEDGSTIRETGVSKGKIIFDVLNAFEHNTQRWKNITLFRETSKEFSTNCQPLIHFFNVGTIFIDGDHRYDHVINDIYLALDLLRGNGNTNLYLDDYHTLDVSDAVKFFISRYASSILSKEFVGEGGILFGLHTP
jgi:Methyltransferase domain